MNFPQVKTNEKGTRLVSARELHAFLESKKQFADWIKQRITKYDLAENQDYTSFSLIGENGGKSNEYALTLDAAKELSMVEGNKKGKEARKYFIECEKQSKQAPKQLTREELFKQAFLESQTQIEELKESVDRANSTIMIQAPKVEYFDKVMSSTGTYNTNLIAKEMGTSAISLNKQLKELGVQYFQNNTWVLTSKYQDKEYTKTKTFTFQSTTGDTKTSMQTVWTEKGRQFIHNLLSKALKIVA